MEVSLNSHENAKNCMNFETLFLIHIIEMTMYKEVSLKSHENAKKHSPPLIV